MQVLRSYRYKLYRSDKNDVLLKDIEKYSEVYNWCVALYKRYYRIYKKNINKYALQKHLTKIKGLYKTEWRDLGSQAIQDITDRLNRSYTLFFGNLKRKKKASPPKFKSRRFYKSFTLKQTGYSLDQDNNEITINKRRYRYFNSRVFDGKIKTLTVKRNHKGEIFIIFSVEQEMDFKIGFETGKIAGFDFGMGTFLVDSEGRKYASPQYLSNSYNKLQELSRSLSKKKKGSNNRKKAKMRLVSLHEKIVNQRNDWQHKMVLQLVKFYDTIFLESLSFLAIQKGNDLKTKKQKKGRARKIMDLAPASFIEKLKYKAAEYGKTVNFINKWFPSSQICSECLCGVGKMSTDIRSWVCPDCRAVHDRDHNAAKNILREGTSSLGIGNVRPYLETMKAVTVLKPESHVL